jgi:predicted alpha/beta superfamily hydrolase
LFERRHFEPANIFCASVGIADFCIELKGGIGVIRSRVMLMAVACLLVVPMLVAAALTVENAAPLVIGETFTVDSRILGEKRRINVYLPPGYAESTGARLPVLYMPDGGIAEDFLHVAGLVQVSVGNGTMRPFILVGIENTERRRDMTGPTENEKDKKIAPRVGGSAAFRAFIRRELMPQVKARYRTTDETAIVGESLAGLFVVETFLTEPDLFDTYIAFDPSLWWNNQKLVNDAAETLRKRPKMSKTLYLANSDEEMTPGVIQRFVDTLSKNAPPGISWHYERMPDEHHSTIYHPAALKAFRAVFKPNTDKRR